MVLLELPSSGWGAGTALVVVLDMNDGRTAQTLPDTLDETDADVQFRFI